MSVLIGVLGQILHKCAPLLLILYANYYLDNEDFGSYVFWVTISSILSAIVIFATTITGLGRAELNLEIKDRYCAVLQLRGVIIVPLSIIFIIGGLVGEIDYEILFSVFLALLAAFFDVELLVLELKKLKYYIWLFTICISTYLLGGVFYIKDWKDLIFTSSVALLISNLFLFIYIVDSRVLLGLFKGRGEYVKDLFLRSRYLFFSTYQVMIIGKMYTMYLGFSGDLKVLGYYGIVEKISDIFRILLQALHKIYLTRNLPHPINTPIYKRNMGVLFLIGLSIVLIFPLTMYIGEFSGFLVEENLFFMMPIFLILVLHHVNNCLGLNYLVIINASDVIFKSNIIAIVLIIGLLVVMSNFDFSASYVIWVFVIGESIILLSRIFLIKKKVLF